MRKEELGMRNKQRAVDKEQLAMSNEQRKRTMSVSVRLLAVFLPMQSCRA